ncbi:MAG: zinc ribbon domain-containing protein [Clostridia bacterium]|nr:zinc ribbon domain-containing protein [Clostridia bacterium]
MFCQKCGAELPDDAAKCGNCGARMYPPDEIAKNIIAEQDEAGETKKSGERTLLIFACLLIFAAALLYALDYFNVLDVGGFFVPDDEQSEAAETGSTYSDIFVSVEEQRELNQLKLNHSMPGSAISSTPRPTATPAITN